MTKPEIIEIIKAERISKGLSQKELAKLAGTFQHVISTFEAGKRDIAISTLCNIAKALNIVISLNKV